MHRRIERGGSVLALAVCAFFVAGNAAAGDRWDYWDPRASIPARVIDTHLGVIGLAATIAGDHRTAAVVDHISGRFPAPAPVVQHVYYPPPPVVEHVYYPPPPVVERVYYPPPQPVVVHHVHRSGCGHPGYGYGYGHGHGRGHGHHRHKHHRRHHRGHYDRYDDYDRRDYYDDGHRGRGRGRHHRWDD